MGVSIRSRTRRAAPTDASRANGHGSTSNPMTCCAQGPKRTARGGQVCGRSPSPSHPSRQIAIDGEPGEPVELCSSAGVTTGPTANGFVSA